MCACTRRAHSDTFEYLIPVHEVCFWVLNAVMMDVLVCFIVSKKKVSSTMQAYVRYYFRQTNRLLAQINEP